MRSSRFFAVLHQINFARFFSGSVDLLHYFSVFFFVSHQDIQQRPSKHHPAAVNCRTNETGTETPSSAFQETTKSKEQLHFPSVERATKTGNQNFGTMSTTDNGTQKVNVLMVGTGEYTTGYVGGKAADSDKGAGVVALTMFDMRRRNKVDRVGMCGVNVRCECFERGCGSC